MVLHDDKMVLHDEMVLHDDKMVLHDDEMVLCDETILYDPYWCYGKQAVDENMGQIQCYGASRFDSAQAPVKLTGQVQAHWDVAFQLLV